MRGCEVMGSNYCVVTRAGVDSAPCGQQMSDGAADGCSGMAATVETVSRTGPIFTIETTWMEAASPSPDSQKKRAASDAGKGNLGSSWGSGEQDLVFNIGSFLSMSRNGGRWFFVLNMAS